MLSESEAAKKGIENDDDECISFQFPIQIQLADGTAATVESYEDLEENYDDWDNALEDGELTFVFPIHVDLADGSSVLIENESDLIELYMTCEDEEEEDEDEDKL